MLSGLRTFGIDGFTAVIVLILMRFWDYWPTLF